MGFQFEYSKLTNGQLARFKAIYEQLRHEPWQYIRRAFRAKFGRGGRRRRRRR